MPLGFLSFGSPGELAIGLPIFLQNIVLSQRLINVENPRYTMTLLPFLFISAIYSASYLSVKFKSQWKYMKVFVAVCWLLSVNRFIWDADYNSRFMQVVSPTSRSTIEHREALKEIVKFVPQDVSVSADLAALPFLADRLELYDIPLYATEVKYVLIDQKDPSPSPRGISLGLDYSKIIDQLLVSSDYKVVKNLDGIILLKKGK